MRKRLVITVLIVVVAIAGTGIFVLLHKHMTSKPVTQSPSAGRYVALGDSVAAGVGLENYSDASACDRTTQAYPSQVAKAFNYSLDSVACGGATTTAGVLGSQTVNQLAVAPQLNTALSGDKPALITITIGANDADWTTYIQKCYTGSCGSQADTDAVNAAIAVAGRNLANILTQIKQTYPTDTPRTVVTGYYRLFPATPKAGSAETTGLDSSELAWIAGLQDNIDNALRATSQSHDFVSFVPVSFAGHELTTDDPWIQGLSANAPFHPTDAGQTAIARQIIAALKKVGTS